jgi:hypothetical protein
VLRSCYSSKWNFPGLGIVRGYYFFADGRPPYPGWSWFGSRNWHKGDGSPWPEFGELENAKQTWRDGSFPTRPPATIAIGTAAAIAGDEACRAGAPPALNAGVDVRCWPGGVPWVPSIGVCAGIGDGSGFSSASFAPPAVGGGVGGGSGFSSASFAPPAVGGGVGGGSGFSSASFAPPAIGGCRGGGSGFSAVTFHPPAIGGGKGGGSGSSSFVP